MSEEERKFVLKLVVLGDPAVGKTSLIEQYIQHSFNNDYRPTIGVNIMIKEMFLEKENIHTTLVLWDIAGQEKYEISRSSFFSGCVGGLLVYDVTRPSTLDHIESKWFIDLKKFSLNEGKFILIGNKLDLQDLKRVSEEDGKVLAEKLDAIDFFETSAKYGENVDKAFEMLVSKILNNYGVNF